VRSAGLRLILRKCPEKSKDFEPLKTEVCIASPFPGTFSSRGLTPLQQHGYTWLL